jgi:hypothetical protein
MVFIVGPPKNFFPNFKNEEIKQGSRQPVLTIASCVFGKPNNRRDMAG